MSDPSTPPIRPDTADTLPVDTGEMDCSPLEDDRQGPDADEGGEESGEARAFPQPRVPSREERRLHDLTHCPARPWCKHCVYGAAAEYPHRTVVGEASKSEIPRVMLDYCFFTEDATRITDDHTDKEEATVSLTALVMKETMCDSVWAYALKSKSVTEDPWIAEQIVDDLNTIGMGNHRIIVKTDQEASIVEMQSEIARRRSDAGTSLENSKVGDSNSNGKVERAIRDVGNMVRTLKSALTENANMTMNLDMNIVPWMVRHAAYLITRCRVRSCGKTSLQLIKGRKSLTELVPFGKTVMFKIPKTSQAVGSFEERWETGVWVGTTIRDGMSLIGTPTGVYKVGTIRRKPDGEQWSQ